MKLLSSRMTIGSLLLVAPTLLSYGSTASAGEVFAPLQCNIDASIHSDHCLSNAVGLSTLFSEEESAFLTIPCGRCVIVDYTEGETITLSGGLNVVGRLHFPASANVVVRTTALYVQGLWSMDTPSEGKSVTVSLYGSEEQLLHPHSECCQNIDDVYGYDCSCSLPEGIGKKPFVVAGGQLNIRAIDEDCSSWTTLKEVNMDTMKSFRVDTSFANCLRPGDDIVVTADRRSYDAHAEFTVDSVDKATGDVVLQEMMPRVFPSEAGPGEPEFAIEVALLRRDVVFIAETDLNEDWIGGHSIVYFTPNVVQIIQGVRFENFGQGGNLGRYPIHFHKSGFTSSLISKNVIIKSNQRCVVIHDTDGVTIDDNVAFDTFGHCYDTETGNERFNVFTHNLGAYTRKLTRSNGQSDSPLVHHSGTSTFWIRNMENTFIGNVAAGSIGEGFWLEMLDRESNQLNAKSFKNNTAHSTFSGLLTYHRGWLPSEPAVIENFQAYNNKEGCKFHITGNLKLKNALIADNTFGVRYGVFNEGVTFEDSLFIGLSRDQNIRLGKTCPPAGAVGIRSSMNANVSQFQNIALKNVIFTDFTCTSETMAFYTDKKLSEDMGDPVQIDNVTIVNSFDFNKPSLTECDAVYQNWFMEDFEGTLGPDAKGPGFLVRDNERTQAFLSEDSCEALAYGKPGCTAFCEGVCFRLVHLTPTGSLTIENSDYNRLQLTDMNSGISHEYSLNDVGTAVVTLPAGQYDGEFLDQNGNPLTVHNVEIKTYRKPRCGNYVTESDFTFRNTASPTAAPTTAPTRYFDMSYVVVNLRNKICPSDERRLAMYYTDSVEECHMYCFDMPSCNFFSFRASDKLCYICSLEDESQLSRGRMVSYEMTSIKATSDFGYELWNGLEGSSKKCPSTSDLISESTGTTRRECYQYCKDTADCGWFSWGEDFASAGKQGVCILCRSDGGIESSRGFNTYEMVQ